MILITGATGHLGGDIINFLKEKNPSLSLSALVRDESKATPLKEKGVIIKKGDYHDYHSLVKAFEGVKTVLLISSSDVNDRSTQQINAVKAAVEAGVKEVLYTSVQHNTNITSTIPWITQSHTNTEAYLKSSGLDYTILRNTLYMDILPMFLGQQLPENEIKIPAGKGKVPFATRLDMAEAIAGIILENQYQNREIALCDSVSYSFDQIADNLAEIAGRKITYTDISADEFIKIQVAAGVLEHYAGFAAGFAGAIGNGEFDKPDSALENYLGRKPVNIKTFLKEIYFN
jgi:NAD(P)H dehydrogenase (quinone)